MDRVMASESSLESYENSRQPTTSSWMPLTLINFNEDSRSTCQSNSRHIIQFSSRKECINIIIKQLQGCGVSPYVWNRLIAHNFY